MKNIFLILLISSSLFGINTFEGNKYQELVNQKQKEEIKSQYENQSNNIEKLDTCTFIQNKVIHEPRVSQKERQEYYKYLIFYNLTKIFEKYHYINPRDIIRLIYPEQIKLRKMAIDYHFKRDKIEVKGIRTDILIRGTISIDKYLMKSNLRIYCNIFTENDNLEIFVLSRKEERMVYNIPIF